MSKKIYDFIGIGIGPFNLGLAALSSTIKDLECLFFDQQDEFQWHPGMLLDSATLQVPFMADLVTMADPTNPFSFLNYLKQNNRIYQFYIREDFFLLRKEYNEYCKWALSKLSSCHFSSSVNQITYVDGVYYLEVLNLKTGETNLYFCRRLVVGTGTSPYIPDLATNYLSKDIFHSSNYLQNKRSVQDSTSITIIGSGQSAAEVFYDLLAERENYNYTLKWYTSSERFFPMEYAKLTLELTSPDFLDYFYHLPQSKKDQLVPRQKSLYKGIDLALINQIYDELYKQTVSKESIDVRMRPGVTLTALKKTPSDFEMVLYHTAQESEFVENSEVVILATGYSYKRPEFMEGIRDRIRWDEKGRYIVSRGFAIDHCENEIFIQNAELHTHGFVTPDLGMAALHNATILNQILGRDHFILEKRTTFQSFCLPEEQGVEVKNLIDEISC